MGVEFNKIEAMPHPGESEERTVVRIVFTMTNDVYDAFMREIQAAKDADGSMNAERTRCAFVGLVTPAETKRWIDRPSYTPINTVSDEQFAREFGHLPKKRH